MYDLIVLDINMPIQGGVETCEQIIKYYNDSGLFRESNIVSMDEELIKSMSPNNGLKIK